MQWQLLLITAKIAWQTHTWFPQEEADTPDETVTHICLDANNLLSRTQLKSDPFTCDCFTRESTDELVVLIDEDHGLHIVKIITHADKDFLDVLAIMQCVTFFRRHFWTKLGRYSPIVEVEFQSANHIDCGPLDLGDTKRAQTLFLLEQFKFTLHISKCFKIGPLRLLYNRSMFPGCTNKLQSCPHIFYPFFEVKSQLGFAKHILLLLKGFAELLDDFFLCFDFLHGICFRLLFELELISQLQVESFMLFAQLFDIVVSFWYIVTILIFQQLFFQFKLFKERLIFYFLSSTFFLHYFGLLVNLSFRTSYGRHEIF